MRIVLTTHPALGEKLLKAILQSGEEVVAVFVPGVDGPSPVRTLAVEKGIPVHNPPQMKSPGVYEEMNTYEADLGVLAFVQDIVPLEVINCPRQGTIMFHPSLLPRHRGGSAMNWPIIWGETTTGLSIIWPDAGIDTGPILLTREVPISSEDTMGSLFFDKLYPLGITALVEAVSLVKQGKAPKIPQDESRATYEPLCQEKHAVIDWASPAPKVYNLIRGTNPQPGATTTYCGEKLKIFDCGLVSPGATAAPGEVVVADETGFTVACCDGGIRVRRVRPAGSAKLAAGEFVNKVGLRPGELLGAP